MGQDQPTYPRAVESTQPPFIERVYAIEDAFTEDVALIEQMEDHHKNLRQKIRDVAERFNVPISS